MRLLTLAFFLVACGARGNIEGPFTGEAHRFVLDGMVLPMTAKDFAADLNGDQLTDNHFGRIVQALSADQNATTATAAMLSSGALLGVLEIVSDDPALQNDDAVGVRFFARDGATVDEMGASLKNGLLSTNVVKNLSNPLRSNIDLPVFKYADPVRVSTLALQLSLAQDASGLTGTVHGALAKGTYEQPAYVAFSQMVTSNPAEFPMVMTLFDLDGDKKISYDEFVNGSLLKVLIAPDLQLTDGAANFVPKAEWSEYAERDAWSFGFKVHLVPCASGNCRVATATSCADRVTNSDESDVDCGGSCPHRCPATAVCKGSEDCQSLQCQNEHCL